MIDRTVRRLLETGDITPEHLQYALEEQLITNQSIIKILVNKGYITEARIKDALEIYEHEDINVRELEIAPGVIKMLPPHLIKNNKVFPLKFENNQFVLGMVEPKDLIAKDTVIMFLGKSVALQRFKISEEEHDYLLNKYSHLFGDSTKDKDLDTPINEHTVVTDETTSHPVESKDESVLSIPVEKIVNRVLDNAIKKRASQITVEPSFENIRIRFKIDDTFYEEARLPRKMYQSFLSHMKHLCNIPENEEKHLHFRGHFKYTESNEKKEINFVMNGVRTVQGDKLILRPGYPIPDLKSLFYYPELYNYLDKVTVRNKGLILVIGTAGSGKSTTLYSILQHKISTRHQLMTIEDTVKYVFENYVSQVELKSEKMSSLQELVYEVSKHNPDVLMVQEIKDENWSGMIEELALSGMLVLTGMRAYNVLSAFKRLKRMSFPNFASIQCIINQKLVRQLCPYCKIKSVLEPDELVALGYRAEHPPTAYKADHKGCTKCYGGYNGLIGVFEVVKMTRDIINLLNKNEHQGEEITKAVTTACIMPFKEYGKRLMMDGIISFEELNKIL